LFSCLFLEDFPEALSIADVRSRREKYRAAPSRAQILLESSREPTQRAAQGDPMAQNFENHTKNVPLFHFFVLPVLGINFVWAIVRVVHACSAYSIETMFVALALLLAALYGRMFALAVQDRVIRLEMQLRLQALLPANLKPRILDFTINQLVALRFASDAELPALAAKVLAENLNDRKTIKKMIQNWQPDNLRA
jgi:hypothetical protein